MKRIFLITLALFAFFTISFVIAEQLGYADPELWDGWLRGLSRSPSGVVLAAVAIVAALCLDLLLPVPSSVVMTAAGVILGPVLGGLVAFVGAISAACIGFWLCRLGGHRWAERLVGEADLERTRLWFERWGVVAIIISRPIPMLTEVLSCLAGLADLRFRTFFWASLVGTLPICFVYSVVGCYGSITNPLPLAIVSIGVPAVGWIITRIIRRRGRRSG